MAILRRLRSSTFLRHVLQLMTGTALAQVVTMVVQIVLLKVYTAEEFGVYAVVLAIVGGLVTVATLRYDLTIVLPQAESDARRMVTLTSRLNAAVCLLALVVLFVTRSSIAGLLVAGDTADVVQRRSEVAFWLPAAAPLAWAMQQLLIVGYWLNRRQEYTQMAGNKIAQSVGVGVGQLGLGVARTGTFGLLGGQLAGLLAALGLIWWRVRPSLAEARGPHQPHLLRAYRRMPLLNGPTAVADAIRTNGITMLVGAGFGIAALGQFSRAWTLLQAPIALINGALQQVFFQKLSVTGREDMLRVVRQSIVRSALLGIVPFGLIYLLAPALFAWWGGSAWSDAGVLAAALVPWLFCNFVTSPISSVFLVVDAQLELMVFSFVFAAIPLGLLWWHDADLVSTVRLVSLVMAGMLLVFCVLALFVARRYRDGAAAEPDGAAATVLTDGDTSQSDEGRPSWPRRNES